MRSPDQSETVFGKRLPLAEAHCHFHALGHGVIPCMNERHEFSSAHAWNAACKTLSYHVFTGAVQIDEAEEDQMASASPQQPDPRESAAAEADEEGSDTEPTQVTCGKPDPTLE